MIRKYKQQEELNLDLVRQIELLEEHAGYDGLPKDEEMKRLYSGGDSENSPTKNMSQSDRLLAARNKLATSAKKFLNFSRKSKLLPQVSEDIDEENEDRDSYR